MRKFNKSLLVAVLFLAVIAFTGAYSFSQKAQGKPAPTPIPIWGVQIFNYGNLISLAVPVHTYKTGDQFARANMNFDKDGRSTLFLWIYEGNPLINVLFSNVSINALVRGPLGPADSTGFPYPYESGTELGLNQFFNDSFWRTGHPKEGYEQISFTITVGADLEDLNIFPMDKEIEWTGYGAASISIWNRFDPLDPNPPHRVSMHWPGFPYNVDKGLFVTRVDSNTWDFRIEGQIFDATESYTLLSTVIGRNKRPISVSTNYDVYTGLANISYKIRLIKNPS